MRRITYKEAAAWRAARHHLDKRAPAGNMLAVVWRLCGLHAQVLSSAALALWARVEGVDRTTVSTALWVDRTLVKTWAMRGTLHLLPADELRLWFAALGTSERFLKPAQWQKHFGLSMAELDRLTEAVGAALEGRLLTREELAKQVGLPAMAENSWGTLLRPATFAGVLCFGPSVGQRVQFTHPATWIGKPALAFDTEAATREVTVRFLNAYGPATVQDLARWWSGGGGVGQARRWMAALGDEAVAVEVEGQPAWLPASGWEQVATKSVRLLPAFDPYVVAASPHAERLLPSAELRKRVYRPQGWISAVLLVNGMMQGVWRHEVKGKRLEVVVEPFVGLPVWARRGVEEEAERLAVFLEGELNLEFRRG